MREGLLTVVSPRVYRLKSNHYAVRGFSAKHGDYMAMIRKTALGALLVSEITKRPIEELRVRTIRSILENGPELHSLPSSADLDAVEAEWRIKIATEPNRTFPPLHAKNKGAAYQKFCRQGGFR